MSTPDTPAADSAPRSALDGVLGVLADRVLQILGADRCTIFMHDPFSKTLWSRVAGGGAVKIIRFPAGAGLAGESFSADRIINIPDAYADARFNREFDQRSGYVTRTVLCVPMHRPDGARAGVIQVLNKKEGVFTAHDEALGAVFCDQAAITIQNAIAQDALETSRARERELADELGARHAELEAAFAALGAQKKNLEQALRRQQGLLGGGLGAAALAAIVFLVLWLRARG
ncbi:MAG: hypothetical protein RLZZ15_235 [Verrucomicrobiota bacterium]|jgi:GAF domain-containing protein